MINSFESYLKLGKARRKTPDSEKAKALLKQSLDRLDYVKVKDINKKTAKFIFEDAYEAIREAAQSLMSLKGFKTYSHEATISFIRDFHKSNFNEGDIHKFDRFRKLRHDSVYRAVPVTEYDAKSSLDFAKNFVKKIKSLMNKEKEV